MPLPESACLLNLQDGTVQLCIRDAQLQMEFQVPAVQGGDIARYKALLPSLMDMHGVSATVKWTRQGAAAHLTVILIPNDASLAHSQVLRDLANACDAGNDQTLQLHQQAYSVLQLLAVALGTDAAGCNHPFADAVQGMGVTDIVQMIEVSNRGVPLTPQAQHSGIWCTLHPCHQQVSICILVLAELLTFG